MQTKTIINVKQIEDRTPIGEGSKVRVVHPSVGGFDAMVVRIEGEYFLVKMDDAKYLQITSNSLYVNGTTSSGAVITTVYKKCEINLEG
ncbi:hypothetical protein [Metaclostridioides mangenotii]|uniref:Uncharacterized protein n=1 Tax=Metaclostridioides mangenotii TaxID=1540 RepID=A0ABS4EBV5_9FIRM|nr:hypothetical protein [Clostridioides mangenotii]MBP1855381.1 hypothetical protein [Clostridioides mangenotii]